MIIDKELRAKLVKHLPDDYQKQGSKATGFSRSMIYKVLHEQVQNQVVLDWLIHAALANKERKAELIRRQAKLAKQL